jgi:hypothetical protein
MTLVRKNFPAANAAEFSNTGRAWCRAVYNATGLVYDPSLQTCLFDDSRSAGSKQDRRRLGTSSAEERQANFSEELNKLKTELQASHAEELETMEANVTALMALQAAMVLQQEQMAWQLQHTNSMLEKLLSQRDGS